MNRIVIKSRVGADGVLNVKVPLSAADSNKEVQLTIEPAATAHMTQEQWHQFVLSTAGSITDPTFVRHEQGDFEQRRELP